MITRWTTTGGRSPRIPTGSGEAFLARRAAAFKVYWEHMPLRASSRPSGPDIQVFRRLSFGRLVEFNVLDPASSAA